jgi:hypothetical protein
LIDQPRYLDKRIHAHDPDMAFHCGDFKSQVVAPRALGVQSRHLVDRVQDESIWL